MRELQRVPRSLCAGLIRNERRVPSAALLLLVLCLGFGLSLRAQTGNGAIQGTVKDASGAVVPAARIVLLQTDTNRQFETATNEVGFYSFPSVGIGRYKLSVSAAGMETWEGNLILQVRQTATVDAVIKVGAAATQITVAGDITPLVTTANATIANTLERARIEQLPLNGRFFQSLVINTTPGLEGSAQQPRVNGMRAASMEYLQDGAVLSNRDTGELQRRPPGLDSIQEFSVETSGSSAKMNRPASTVVTTRSGTNQAHGAAFETARNNAVGIARARTDYYTKPPHLVRNEFGASLGGPVYLPRLYNGRDKSFFFVTYEAYRNMSASTTNIDMPTLAMRQGDFSGLVDGSGRRYTVYDAWSTGASPGWTRVPFPNNQIPAARQNVLAKYLYSVTPAPTRPEVNPLVASNYFGLAPNNRRDYTLTTRFDHRLSDKDQVFLRFTYGKSGSFALSSNGSPITLDGGANSATTAYIDSSGVASWTHTFSPTFFSETLFNVGNEDFLIYSGTESNWPDRLGLPNPFHVNMWPYLSSTGFGMDYEYADNRRNNITRIFTLDQNFTKVKGRHEFQFGGRFRNERLYVLPDQQQMQGQHSYSSIGTGLYDPASGSAYSSVPYTGHAAASLYLGLINYYSNQFVRGWYYLNAREYAGYFQDNFKVNSRLTLNYGVRWEFYPNISENNNILTGFNLANHAVVNSASTETMIKAGATLPSIISTFEGLGVKFESPSQAGLPDKLIHSNPNDFGPRAGFAYRLADGPKSFVLRGGYALFGFPIPLRTFNARMRSNPPTALRFYRDASDAAQSPDGLPNYGLRSAPSIVAGVNSANIIDPNNARASVSPGSFRTSFFDPNQPTSRAHEWNLSLEKTILPETVAKLQYIGNHGARLDQFLEYNENPPAYIWYMSTGLPLPSGTYSNTARRPYDQKVYGTVEQYSKIGWSNCQSFQFELRRRYTKGYGYQFFYVMSNPMVAGGNGWSSDLLNMPNYYLPGTVPTDIRALDRLLFYRRDSAIPKHRLRWNWIADLPIGRGKRFAGNAGPWLDRVIGGWQFAGYGSLLRGWNSIATNFWGPTGKIEVYGKKYPIQDCRSGQCIPGYLWWNGYIPANRINSTDASGKPNGVMGVPADYKPAVNYVINWGSTTLPANAPANTNVSSFWDTNTVWIPLKNGNVQRATMDTGLNPMINQLVPGPWNSNVDASLFKVVRINERVNLRFNADFFNVLNMPGTNGPNSSTGIVSLQSSWNSPRQLQLTLRLQW